MGKVIEVYKVEPIKYLKAARTLAQLQALGQAF